MVAEVLSSRAAANALAFEWLAEMSQRPRPLASATQARRLSALRSLVTMAGQLGVVDWSLSVEGPKVQPYRETRGPTAEQTEKLLAACGGGLRGRRDWAMLSIVLTIGLRRFELAALEWEQINRERMEVTVVGKGGKVAALPLAAETLAALDGWAVRWAAEHGEPADRRVFRSLARKRFGQPLEPKSVWDIVQAIGEKAGVRVWPHGLRHAAITSFLDETGGDVRAAQRLARHGNIQTTIRYDDNRQDLARVGVEQSARKFRIEEAEKRVKYYQGLSEDWCYYCGSGGARLLLEHKTPKSRGGSDENTNLVTACVSCNVMKSFRTFDEFRALMQERIGSRFRFFGEDIYCFVKPEEEPARVRGRCS